MFLQSLPVCDDTGQRLCYWMHWVASCPQSAVMSVYKWTQSLEPAQVADTRLEAPCGLRRLHTASAPRCHRVVFCWESAKKSQKLGASSAVNAWLNQEETWEEEPSH